MAVSPQSLRDSPILPLLKSQRDALFQIAKGMPLSEALKRFALDAEKHLGDGVRISILLLDQDDKRLRLCAAPSLPDAYNAAVNGIEIGPGAGSCGTAAFEGGAVFATDIASDSRWAACRDLALRHGLQACWSMPIQSVDGRILGTLANYYPQPKSPTSEDIEAMALAAHAVALAIERHESERTLKGAEARHRQIFNSATDFAIVSTDLRGRVTDWNEGAHRILGWTEEEMAGQSLHRIFTPDDVANGRPEAEMQCALTQGYSPDERWHMRKSGERFWAVGQLTPLKGDAGDVISFVKIMRDRTAHKDTDERLERLTATLESEVAQRTRERDRLWRNSLDLLLVIGPDGVLRAINPVWTAAFGYAPEELVGHHFEPFVHPDDIGPTIDAIARASRGPLDHFEVRIRHKDGSYRWVAWRAAPEEGMVYANGRDITVEKRQAEQLLQANEARLNLALEAGEMGAWEWNPRSNTTLWLHGTAALHGMRDAQDAAAMSMDEYMRRYVHPDDREILAAAMARSTGDESSQRAEYRIVWPDDSVHWIEVRGRMFFDDIGKPSQMVGVSVNITRRKRSEQDLRFLARASAELSSLVDPQSTLDRLAFLAVPDFADWCAIDLLQRDGSLKRVAVAHADRGKVQLAHELHRRFPPDRNLPHGIWQVIRTGRAECIREFTGEMLEQAISDRERLAVMKELGFRSYIGVPLSAHGKTLGAVSFVAAESGRLYGAEDMALAEDLARRAAVAIENAELYRALRESDQAKNVFLATLSHELRNPLAAIVSGLTLMTLAIEDKKRLEHYAKLMERQAHQLTRLVDDLMDVSRITTGKTELKREATSLAGILNSAIETSRPAIEAGQHKLSVLLPGGATELIADPVRLTQVFSNLLTNAAKYSNPGGEIHVTLECLPDEFVVHVRDAGIGIPADMLKNVFKIFTQAAHLAQRGKGGLGIGLSLVDGLVRMHGGWVEAFSKGEGQGSEFIVHLPRTAPEQDAARTAPAAASSAAQEKTQARRILVVDDNVDAATTISDILGVLGHEVRMAHDGLAAVAAASEMKPDVILLDIGLPGIDGYEAARRIRAQPGIRRSTMLIALTGWGQENDKKRAYEAGFDRHWVKPVGIEQLKKI
jgi:PAS domain S-box-containing protein